MVRSMAEKPTSSGGGVEHDLKIGADRPALQPNSVRIARSSQVVGGRTQHLAFLHHRRQVGRVADCRIGSESGISVHPLPVRIGVGNAELRENLLFEIFHGFGVVVFSWSYPIKCRKPWTARWLR